MTTTSSTSSKSMDKKRFAWEHFFGLLGIVTLAVGCYFGLAVAPPERHMGEVQRIMYVHVPCAWVGLLSYVAASVAAVGSLWTSRPKWDAAMIGMVETGLVLNALLLMQGSIWAKPTWGHWWVWDVRLTTSAILLILFAGVLALRSFVQDPEKRATWSAVATILATADVILVYFSVKWWQSIHQVQSTPETVDRAMVLPLRINAFAILFLAIWMVTRRARIELMRRSTEEVAEPARQEWVHA